MTLLLQRREWGIRLDRWKFFREYLKDKRTAIFIFCAYFLCSIFLYFLYDVRYEPILYTAFLILLLTIPFVFLDFRRSYSKYQCLKKALNMSFPFMPELPEADSLLEQNYQHLLRQVLQSWQDERIEQKRADTERDDYYTLWTHQIKSPIYSMDLMLQTGDMTPGKWKMELIRTSQYVDIALKYLQLEGQYPDLCLEHIALLPMVQDVIKKYSSMFIAKKLKVELLNLNGTILTDKKWFSFIIEQLISNAVKYTEHGSISVYQPSSLQVCISDTGIGISAEDLPRLFEKGYTGFNGRIHQKSTGCGLYMCKKVSCLLGCTLSISSQLDKGTTVTINLPERDFPVSE